ncbi:MAG TPA: Wzz/FepE/Etk N-terminal domain-containing protein [Ktedonobacterales bacterium]|nr:Wzz/FepE/Etk N-terminal domain-containing protein [Ktedonobacterales bacterium]
MPDEVRTSRSIHRYLAAFARWFWLAILCVVVAAAGTFVMTAMQTPVYRATTVLFVGQQSANVPLVDTQLVTTYQQLINQPAVLAAAASQVGGISSTDLARSVQTAVEGNTSLIEVSVDDADPNRAAALSNAVAGAFIAKMSGQPIAASYPVVIFQPAVPPTTPDHPKPVLNTLVGGACGLVIALVLIQLLDALDNRTHPALPAEKKPHLNGNQGSNTQHLTDIAVGDKRDAPGDYQAC